MTSENMTKLEAMNANTDKSMEDLMGYLQKAEAGDFHLDQVGVIKQFIYAINKAELAKENPEKCISVTISTASSIMLELLMRVVPRTDPVRCINTANAMLTELSKRLGADLNAAITQFQKQQAMAPPPSVEQH